MPLSRRCRRSLKRKPPSLPSTSTQRNAKPDTCNANTRYKLGDPTDQSTTTGPVISRHAVKTIQSHIDDALSKGAINATPPNDSFLAIPSQNPEGNYISPTVLTNVTHDMTVMKNETFGPVLPIMKVSSDEEAVALMNDSEYGLTASVWTRDISRGEELIAEIEAGTVFVNRCDYPSPVRTSHSHPFCFRGSTNAAEA